ncbi:MAG TPA: transcription elongation factor Spt5 [Candidatus Nanopusillus sp.]|nr:transcription elongation factor Spt5 [Candidatus Nanopusillus sp.]HIP90176.1 transcription elongation factor Spt5 [Candidatus Nanopusillus sp.]
MPFYAVRTTAGKEELVVELIAHEVKRQKLEIYSIMSIPGLKGYIIIEASNPLEVQRAIHGMRHAKVVLPQEIHPDEIFKFLEEEKKVEEFKRGDIVEILIGAFKGTRAKVLKIDAKKEELTVELLDTPVPLNITVPANGVRIIKREEE